MNSMLSTEDLRSLFLWFLERHGATRAFRQNLPSLYGVLGKDALTEYVNRLAISHDFKYAISSAFTFSTTPEGLGFWGSLSAKWVWICESLL